jgi:hypothetical protein
MAIEIVDLPIKTYDFSIVILVDQRVSQPKKAKLENITPTSLWCMKRK